MFTEGIYPIGDGLLDIDEARLSGLLVPDDINEIYEVEQTPFARGKFAAVRRAVHKNSGVHFAAKFLKRRRRAQSSDKEIKHEIAVLTLCDGAENIVKLNAVHESRSDTALLLELATGGELQTFLDNEECLNEAHARFCMREVLKALHFLHKRSIAHLDLKPQNILLSGERIEDGLKLCDFGISRVVAEGTQVREIVGTPDYVAPEVLQYEPLSLLSDIWSVGVLAYVLLSGFSPFGGDTKQETFLNISQCALEFPDKLFAGVSGAAIDFIRRALRIKPSDRMTAAGCLEHSWLKDECQMGRQIYITKKNTENEPADQEDDDEDEEPSLEDEEEDDDEDELSTDDPSGFVVDDDELKMDSSPIAVASSAAPPLAPKPVNVVKKPVLTSTATHVVVVSPPGRRQSAQSTDANKENTYLATKKITPSTSNTTTIIIAPTELKSTDEHGGAPHISTVTVPNGEKSPCLFPDAPTTPKVIRKAPNTDTSPTSVKALVKKFQLEGGDACKATATVAPTTTTTQPQIHGTQHAATLKEAHGNHQHQKKPQLANGKPTIATIANGKLCVKMPEKDADKAKKYPGMSGRHSNGGVVPPTAISCNFSGRRSSEPAAGIHKKAPMSLQQPHQRTSTDSSVTVNSFRSTCVFGLNSDGTATITTTPNGCRHPTITVAVTANGSASTSMAGGDAVDGSTSCSSGSGSSANAANASSAILFANHHQLHHHTHPHHHHHHHVAKNVVAGNNLSLDQGIIC